MTRRFLLMHWMAETVTVAEAVAAVAEAEAPEADAAVPEEQLREARGVEALGARDVHGGREHDAAGGGGASVVLLVLLVLPGDGDHERRAAEGVGVHAQSVHLRDGLVPDGTEHAAVAV